MHNHEFKRCFSRVSRALLSLLPIIFWLLLIYAFDEPQAAAMTVGAALVHEIGHITCILIIGKQASIRGDVSGFRIAKLNLTSYKEELLVYLSGPLVNLLCALVCLLPVFPAVLEEFAALSIATAIANLIPIKGQDGYGIARVLIEMHPSSLFTQRTLDDLSLAFSAFLLMLSLYLMQKCDAGYWICAVFLVSMVTEIARRLS